MIENIDIVLASDNNYAQHVAVVAASILSNTKEKVHFHVLSDGIAVDKLTFIKQTINNLGGSISCYDLSAYQCFNELFTSGHISKAAYFRLDIANILPQSVNKVIYLDVDLLVLKDIVELWQFDLKEKPLAAVPDYGIMASKRLMQQKHKVIGLPLNSDYFNSGVVIMDLKQWREYKYAEQVIKLAAEGNLPHHDQDALNKVFMEKWIPLPLKWNVIPPVFNLFPKILVKRNLRINAVNARRNKAVLHFAGRYKPWEFELKKNFNDQYYYYLRKTAFSDAKMPQPGKNMKGKSLVRQLIRLYVANYMEKLFS